MQGYAIIGFFSIVEANKQASVILSRTVGIQEDQLKLNSKLAFPNYLQLKEWLKHELWLETDHYLSLQEGGGGFKILFVPRKNLSDTPLKALQCSPFPSLAVCWQSVFSFTLRWWRLILPPFSLKTTWSFPPPPPQKKSPLFPAGNKNDEPLTSWRLWNTY